MCIEKGDNAPSTTRRNLIASGRVVLLQTLANSRERFARATQRNFFASGSFGLVCPQGGYPLARKKELHFTWLHGQVSELCRCRKGDHIALFCRNRRERDALRLCDAVLAPEVAVGFHCQRAAVFVSEPPGNGRNVHTTFNAARCKQVPQIVMCDAICADLFARAIKRLLTFADAEYFCVQ